MRSSDAPSLPAQALEGVVDQQDQRQEVEDEEIGGEDHGSAQLGDRERDLETAHRATSGHPLTRFVQTAQ